MKLIGGNISDTPVKEVGDGSAFNVGGAVGSPALVEIGTVPAAGTSLTNINHSYRGSMGNGQTYSNSAIVKWSDNSFGIFWAADASPHELFYCHVQTNANGTFASEGARVDLSGDFVGSSSGFGNVNATLDVKKVSASRVIVSAFRLDSTYGTEELVYDLNGDTLTQHGSVFDHGASGWNNASSGACKWVALKDADHGVSFWTDTNSQTTFHGTPIHVTTSKTAGTQVARSCSYKEGNGGLAFTDNTGQIWTICGTSSMGTNTLHEWTVSTGSTPSVAVSAGYSGWQRMIGAAYGSAGPVQSDGGFDGGGGLGAALINRNDIERGRFIAPTTATGPADSSAGYVGVFGGVTTNNSFTFIVGLMGVKGTDWGSNYANAKIVEFSYDDATYWGRYALVNIQTNNDIFFSPFNFNWSTYSTVLSDVADLPNATTDVSVGAADVWGVLKGSDSATNLCVIFDEGSNDINYLNVPFTV
jgi:hypothetical protein